MRILVIEDEKKVAAFIQSALGQEGYAVDVLPDGEEAGSQAAIIDYDCVVLDLMLPGRDGFDVCRELRRRGDTPILMLTARDDELEACVFQLLVMGAGGVLERGGGQ